MNRAGKYAKKLEGSVFGRRYEETKRIAVIQEASAITRQVELENKVKKLLTGVPTTMQHYYTAFALGMNKRKNINEWRLLWERWLTRGLNIAVLNSIALNIFGWTPPAVKMYEYFTEPLSQWWSIYGALWQGQTITIGAVGPNETFKLFSIKLKLFRLGNPGIFIVGIRNIDVNELPTGPDLSTGSMDGNKITSSSAGAWYEIKMAGLMITPGRKLAIVARAPNGTTLNSLRFPSRSIVPLYPGGHRVQSINSGVSWSKYTGLDHLFEVWGIGPW